MEAALRGFLYQDSQGQWILSDVANLKSCCINVPAKAAQQVLLEGNLLPTSRVITVKGTLQIYQGRLLLTNATVEQISYAWVGWLIAFIACGSVLAVWMRRKKHLIDRAA